jgi:hypothetical protein
MTAVSPQESRENSPRVFPSGTLSTQLATEMGKFPVDFGIRWGIVLIIR